MRRRRLLVMTNTGERPWRLLTFIPSLGTALSGARTEEGGLASGIVNTRFFCTLRSVR
ncbi:hypothetical protein GCM10009612_74280 [Streptomyces beijiangensis]